MKKIQQELFIIGSLPTAVLILFGLTIARAEGQSIPPGVIWLFIVLSIAATGFLGYRLRILFNSDSDNNKRQEKHADLESLLHSIKLLKQELASENRNMEAILNLCNKPIKTIVGFTNRINQGNHQDLSHSVSEITRTARNLHFLIHEAQDHALSTESVAIEPWQIADDALGMLSPIMSSNKRSVNVKVLKSCPARMDVEGEQPLSLLFHYLLHYFLEMPLNDCDLVLNVSYTHDGDLTFALDEENYPISVQLCRRFRRLLSKRSTFEDGLLYLPVSTVAGTHDKPGEGLTGIIICEGKAQRESLYERLHQLGVQLTDDCKSTNLDFCLVDDETSEAFRTARQSLNADAAIILLQSNSLYQRKNWHHLRDPIDQGELKQLLSGLQSYRAMPSSYDILAVDDNVSNLRLLELQLTELGHSVTTTDNGVSAVDLCRENHFDLVFLDLQMPGMGGLEATKKILELDAETPPIIGLTADATSEERQAYLDGGMSQVIIKPIKIDNLKSLLLAHIENIKSKPAVAARRNIADTVFDRELSLSTANDRPELAEEFYQLLIATIPSDQAQINMAFKNEDLQALKEAVHKLHGAIRFCGVPRLENAVGKLELILKTSAEVEVKGALGIVNHEISALMTWHRENLDPFGNSIASKLGANNNLGSE